MKVQIALFKEADGFIAKAIKWQTDSPYCHAALLFNDKYLIESVAFKGVIARIVTPADLHGVDLFDVPSLDEEHESVIYEFALDQVGKGYDYWGCLRFISRDRLPENDRWFCSELVAAAFKAAEYLLLERQESWQVSPGKLAISPLVRPAK
jgi:uncharacterized protein YycO